MGLIVSVKVTAALNRTSPTSLFAAGVGLNDGFTKTESTLAYTASASPLRDKDPSITSTLAGFS